MKETPQAKNLVELLMLRSQEQGENCLYTFLQDGEGEEINLSYRELDQKARVLAATLQKVKMQEERALLLYPPSLDYILAFFGCLYAKVIAVPAYPPDPNRLSRTLPRLLSIIRDSEAKFVLTTQSIKSMAEFLFQEAPELRSLEWIATDDLSSEEASVYQEMSISSQDLAFLQYTSGSTGDPKGVMLSHENLLANLNLIYHAFGLQAQAKAISWLPPYHDMGLIGGIIEPMYAGISAVLFSPLDFLQKPLRWLKTISKYKGTASGGPNFAYDLCVKKATFETIQGLDLSSWDLAFSGAEPVQLETIRKFSDVFAPCGFKEEAFYPCYGLAEASLIVSGGKKSQKIRSKKLDKKALENHQVKENEHFSLQMVGCGNALKGQQIRIVDPETLETLACSTQQPQSGGEGEASRVQRSSPLVGLPVEGATRAPMVAEIWASGKSIAQGYWKKEEETQHVFKAYTSEGDGPFLRTGDLGFLSDGELYVTGRIKDVMIFAGANHYPQDIEASIEKENLPLRTGCGAAFSVSEEGEEKLVIVWEVNDSVEADVAGLEWIVSRMRESISRHHEIHISGIVLIKKGNIPKTSSGKIQHQACKLAYFSGTLDILFEWKEKKFTQPLQATAIVSELDLREASSQDMQTSHPHNVKSIQNWLLRELSFRLKLGESEIDIQKPFTFYGIDSKEALGLAGDLEDWLHVKLSPTVLWQYPDIKSLADFICNTSSVSKKQAL